MGEGEITGVHKYGIYGICVQLEMQEQATILGGLPASSGVAKLL
jgi:hypothetical protein